MRQTKCKWNLHAAWLKMTLLLVFTKQANDTHVLMEKKTYLVGYYINISRTRGFCSRLDGKLMISFVLTNT